MLSERTSVGLDVHARSVAAAAIDGVTGELIQSRLLPAYDHIRSWLDKLAGPVKVTYEAGPTGFGLARALSAAGIECVVAAPSKIQRPAGDRVKTDARDAVLLARLLRLGDITAVSLPSVQVEAARDLVRAREDCRRDLTRSRHQLRSLLLRHGQVYYDGRAWTQRHERWLRNARKELPEPATRAAFDEHYEAVIATSGRRTRLDTAIGELAATSQFAPVVARLACLRGVDTLTAFGLAVEIGDWTRFSGSSIGAFVGLVPSEHSSGQTRVQGPITRAGNGHARRLLIEAAWHHRTPYRPSHALRERWARATAASAGNPAAARRGDQANRRLHQRWTRLDDRNKRPVIANTAIARELAGWCWSLAIITTNPTQTYQTYQT